MGLGVLILLAPIVLTLVNDYQLDQVAQRYERGVQQIQPDARLAAYVDDAHAYNARLAASGHHAMPPNSTSPGFEEYQHTLDAPELQGVIARITIPRINVDLPIYHTTDSSVLYHGAGHMFGSDLPVGGAGTTSVVSAHTGMVNATMFDGLPRLRSGDDVYISVMGQTLHYQVRTKRVVGPFDYQAVTYEPDADKLILVTCTPYGLNTDRLLVETVRVHDDPHHAAHRWVPRLSWWMLLDLLLLALVLAWVVRRERKRRGAARGR